MSNNNTYNLKQRLKESKREIAFQRMLVKAAKECGRHTSGIIGVLEIRVLKQRLAAAERVVEAVAAFDWKHTTRLEHDEEGRLGAGFVEIRQKAYYRFMDLLKAYDAAKEVSNE